MNRKMLIIILSLCLVIGIGAAGTAMMTGGSDLIGNELSFNSDQVTLYRAPNGENSMVYDTATLPSPVTIIEEIKADDGSVWYGVSADGWADVAEDYIYVRADDCTVIPAAAEENTEEPAIEAVELEDGDIVINSEDAQLSAEVVKDKTVAEIEDGLSLPEAEENVSRETYCFDIHAEEDAETTVSISGIATADSNVTVYHMYDDTDYSKYEVIPCTVEADGTVTFTTTSFSEFYFTVDFHNGDLTYSIAGESSVLLSEVFSELSISENAYDAESVVFSDPSLISVARQADGDWLLTSLAAFDTEETLTITFSDGHEYVMRVTDAASAPSYDDDDDQRYLGYTTTSWGKTSSYQLISSQFNNGITVTYSSAAAVVATGDVTVYMQDSNGNSIDNGTAEHIIAAGAFGTHMSFSSRDGRYWYHVYKNVNLGYSNVSDSITSIEFSTMTNLQDKPHWKHYLYVKAYSTAIGTKDDNGYCKINQITQASTGTERRNVELQVWDYTTNNYKTVKTYSNILFPDRTMTTSDLNVSGYDSAQYDCKISISGKTYIVQLSPKTYTVKAGIMSDNYGDKRGWGVTKVTVSGGIYPTSASTTKEGSSGLASVKVVVKEYCTVTAEVKEGYRFIGWYTSDSEDGECVKTDKTYTFSSSAKDETITLYARAVEISPLYVDCYWRAGNGRYGAAWGIGGDNSSFMIKFTGADLTKNYTKDASVSYREWWYLVNGHVLLDGTKATDLVIKGTKGEQTDTNAIAVGTNNPNDSFYDEIGKFYCGTYTIPSSGKTIPFWKAGVGLDIVALGYVRYQANTQQWKYAYQWSYTVPTYNFKTGEWEFEQKPVSFPLDYKEGIPVPLDRGRINFLYKEEPEKGTNSYALQYYANCNDTVLFMPEKQVVTGLNYPSYWFTIDGLADIDGIVDDQGNTFSIRPYRAGHTFIGWSTDRNHDPYTVDKTLWTPEKFNQPITSDDDFDNRQIEVKANTTGRLYAIWVKNTSTLTLTYYNWDTVYKTKTGLSNPYTLTASDNLSAPTKDGYVFDGWYYTPDCVEGTKVNFGSDKLYADTDVYAKWVEYPEYTIEYYKDSLSSTMLGTATGTAAPDTTISLTPEQLNAYKPISGYNDGALQDKNVTVKADGSSVVRVLYTTANAQYTIEYYKDSLSGTCLGSATLTGTIGSSISVAAGTGEGQLDYKRPAGYKSGVQKTNANVNADGSSVVKVVYEADIVNYYIEAYVMDTAGKYPTTATYSKTMTANSGTLVTSASYQNPDAWKLQAGAFSYDTEAKNVTSGTLNSSSDSAVVLKVYFARNQFTINWIVTKDDDPGYKLEGSTKYYYEQAVTPASVTTPEYYTFDNWAKGGVAWPTTMPANSVTIKGEFIRQRADLTITKNGMKSGETALFTVKGAGLGSGLTVMVQNGESVTIKGLAVGETYTVTENGWSWKYALPSPMESKIAATGSAVTFTNTPKNIHWLTDEFFVDNKFNA